MKKSILLFFIFLSLNVVAQEDAWVYFNIKNNTEFYFNNPLQMLSQRALDRRALQNIPLDLKDIPIDQNFINQITATNGITVMAKSKWLNALHVRGSTEKIRSLKNFTFVNKVVFANRQLNASGKIKFNVESQHQKTNKKLETATSFNYGSASNQIQMLNGHLLHQQNFTGAGKIIAVLDSGFPGVDTAASFSRLHENNQILGGYNFVDRSSNFYNLNSHGTLVLSTMGGFLQNQLVGTAPDSSYYLFITEDVATENPVEESLWVEAAELSDNMGVDIINTSLGYFDFDNSNYNYTYNDMDGKTSFIARGAEIAFSRGMIVVVSGGNSGNSANPHIGTPADAANVLTVGAVNANKQYVNFSSVGPSSDNRVKPNVMALGLNATISNPNGTITAASGTSFSSPIICGLVACLWQAMPNKTNHQILDLIKSSSDKFSTPNAQYGYGIPDFSAALNNNVANKNNFLLFPNPVNDILKITFSDSIKNSTILIYNTLGQICYQNNISNPAIIPMNDFESGFYFYKIESSVGTQTGKILKR